MANVRQALYTIIASDSAVSALVGTNVYRTIAKQGAGFPHIVYRRTATDRQYVLAGSAQKPVATFDVQCWGTTADSAEAVGDAVRAALDGAYGTYNGTELHKIFILDEHDDFEFQTEGTEKPAFRTSLEVLVHYRE